MALKRVLAGLALLANLSAPSAAIAANSTNGPPPRAAKEGGVAGDPRGAIRAIGGTSQTGFKQETNKVDVPDLGSDLGRGLTRGTPAGTTGPR